MNKEMVDKLSSVIDVLGHIEVKGKNNLLNLGGSIAILEEVRQNFLETLSADKSK